MNTTTPLLPRIDVHAYVWPEAYLDLMNKLGHTRTAVHRNTGAGITPEELEARFALMEKAGISRQILSATPLSPHFEQEEHAFEAARFINDEYARLVRQWPERFAAFAALPLPHITASLAEMKRALDELQFCGVAITTAILGRSPAEDWFLPLLQELDRRKAVLYIHPEGCGAHSPLIRAHNLTWMVGAPVEDTVCVAQLITRGIPSRFPGIRIINSHLGGALPMILQRMDNQYVWESPETPERPGLAAKRMWYDSVAHGHIPALRAAADTPGADRILLGTDFPYENGDLFLRAVSYIAEGLDTEAADMILHRNAAQLFVQHEGRDTI